MNRQGFYNHMAVLKNPMLFQVRSTDVSVRSGPTGKADVVTTLNEGDSYVISTFKKDEGGVWGRVEARKGWCYVEELENMGEAPKVNCVMCETVIEWKEWGQHKKAKKHKQNFERNAYENRPDSIDKANELVELAAVKGDETICAGIKPIAAVPPPGCGRWSGAPPEKKEAGEKKNEPEEDVPLTEAQQEWLKKTESRRAELQPGTVSYNNESLPVLTTKSPDHVPPFGAGRGRIL